MEKDQQAMAFKVANIRVSNQFASNITQQIQYYFSMANLATDHYLRNIISNNHKGWVKFQILLKFSKLQKFFESEYDFMLSVNQKIRIIQQCLKKSTKLKTSLNGVKISRKVIWKKQFQRVLYLEGENMDQNDILSTLSVINIQKSQVIFRRGQGWCFIEIQNATKENMQLIQSQLKTNLSVRLLTMDQFLTFQQEVKKLIQDVQIQEEVITQKMDKQINPHKIYEFNGFETAKKKQNNKGKTKKIKKQQLGDYTPSKLFLVTRNKKTRQDFEKMRAQKIQIWKKKKQEKRSLNQCKMEIQNSDQKIEP